MRPTGYAPCRVPRCRASGGTSWGSEPSWSPVFGSVSAKGARLAQARARPPGARIAKGRGFLPAPLPPGYVEGDSLTQAVGEIGMATRSALRHSRRRLVQAWERYVLSDRATRTGSPMPEGVRPENVTSWERSADRVSADVAEAPLADPDDVRAAWEATPLRTAVARIEPQLRLAADDGGLVVAVTDPAARILWTCEGSVMRSRARGVNFVPGGRWDESSVGTNALDLALRRDHAATVYSAEHFSSCVHDWTCWAAPIHDPATGR